MSLDLFTTVGPRDVDAIVRRALTERALRRRDRPQRRPGTTYDPEFAAVQPVSIRLDELITRFCFRDRLREAHVSDDLVDTLMDWTRRTMRETYGRGPRISALAKAVERVDYSGLDLGHLRVQPDELPAGAGARYTGVG